MALYLYDFEKRQLIITSEVTIVRHLGCYVNFDNYKNHLSPNVPIIKLLQARY